jgi:hypothetical protein
MAENTPVKKIAGPRRNRRVWLERRALELSRNCPVDLGNPVDCPLFGLRPLPAPERKVWIARLKDDELEYLASYHACCHAERHRQQEGRQRAPVT